MLERFKEIWVTDSIYEVRNNLVIRHLVTDVNSSFIWLENARINFKKGVLEYFEEPGHWNEVSSISSVFSSKQEAEMFLNG